LGSRVPDAGRVIAAVIADQGQVGRRAFVEVLEQGAGGSNLVKAAQHEGHTVLDSLNYLLFRTFFIA
jgi:hypothetical protein